MFCPKCAADILSDETKFSSKCGFMLQGVRKALESSGKNEDFKEISNFQKGIKFGIKLLLLSLILIPAFQILGGFFTPEDRLVESSPSSSWFDLLGNAILITLFLAGVARIFYAFVFESAANKTDSKSKQSKEFTDKDKEKYALPPSQSVPISDFGKWKTTDELFEPIFSKQKISGELK
ncbi:MAG: hypothetical protein LC768_00805 [Acidobacteria bacterium]|nr:hypothetical protein [Acidobacteriota bacterium]